MELEGKICAELCALVLKKHQFTRTDFARDLSSISHSVLQFKQAKLVPAAKGRGLSHCYMAGQLLVPAQNGQGQKTREEAGKGRQNCLRSSSKLWQFKTSQEIP